MGQHRHINHRIDRLSIHKFLHNILGTDGIRINSKETVQVLIVGHTFTNFIKIQRHLALIIPIVSTQVGVCTHKHEVLQYICHVPLKDSLYICCGIIHLEILRIG